MSTFHTLDNLIQGLDFQELIDTIHCNEAWHDEIRVKKVFNELLQMRIREARQSLRANMTNIINELAYNTSPETNKHLKV